MPGDRRSRDAPCGGRCLGFGAGSSIDPDGAVVEAEREAGRIRHEERLARRPIGAKRCERKCHHRGQRHGRGRGIFERADLARERSAPAARRREPGRDCVNSPLPGIRRRRAPESPRAARGPASAHNSPGRHPMEKLRSPVVRRVLRDPSVRPDAFAGFAGEWTKYTTHLERQTGETWFPPLERARARLRRARRAMEAGGIEPPSVGAPYRASTGLAHASGFARTAGA